MPQTIEFDQHVADYLVTLNQDRPEHVRVILERIKRGLYPGDHVQKTCTNPIIYETLLDPLMLPDGTRVGYRIVWVPGNYNVACVVLIHDYSIESIN